MGKVVEYVLSLKDLLTRKIENADQAVEKFEGHLNKAQGAANSLGRTLGIAFSGAAVVAFGAKMIQAGSQVENALTGLETLLKDKAAAQGVINNTMEDATRTPFAFEGLLAANKALISAGVSAVDARKDVLNLANAIAATGGGDDELQRMVVNLQQIKNTGKATALDIKQFAYAGVNIYKVLAEATGQPIEKVKDMEISYDQLTMALARAHDEGGIYAGGLEKMAGNTSVQISNLGDSIFQLSVQMFNDLKPAISAVISGLSSFVGMLRSAWEWTVRNKDIIFALAVGIGVAAAAWGVYQLVINASTIATGLLTIAQWALNAAMTANPIGLVIVAIGALTAGVVYAYNKFGTFRAILWGVWEFMKSLFNWMYVVPFRVLMELGGMLANIFHPSKLMEHFNNAKNILKNGVTDLVTSFKKGYDDGMKDFASSQAGKTKAAPKTVTNAAEAGGKKTGSTIVPTKNETKGAVGQKAVTISVSIGNLIKDFSIRTTNITEGTAKLREMVAQALVGATNDSQLIAGQ